MSPQNLEPWQWREQTQSQKQRVLDDVVVVTPGSTNSPQRHLILPSPKRDERPPDKLREAIDDGTLKKTPKSKG
jgi:hypothetical protein